MSNGKWLFQKRKIRGSKFWMPSSICLRHGYFWFNSFNHSFS